MLVETASFDFSQHLFIFLGRKIRNMIKSGLVVFSLEGHAFEVSNEVVSISNLASRMKNVFHFLLLKRLMRCAF